MNESELVADEHSEADPRVAQLNAQANFSRLVAEVPRQIQERESRVAAQIGQLSGSAIKKLRALHKELSIILDALSPFVACKSGCTACCHYNISIFPVEADLIAKRTGHTPRAASLPHGDFHGKPCPFLRNGLCGIYESRPMACRTHFALTATNYWCDPQRANAVKLPLIELSQVQAAFEDIVRKDGRYHRADVRQVFGLECRV